jgi:flagellar hook-associated protein 1 FlgK
MAGIFNTLNTANKGMNAQQTALHTTAHNISNANTEGYSRQRVELKADLAYTYGGIGQLGTGVKIDSVIRLVDEFTNKQIRQETATMSQFSTKSEVLEQMETIFNEPSDTGLNFNISEMFKSWQGLAKNPESLSSKTIVIEKSRTFADTLNQIQSQLESLISETEYQIDKQITDFNAIVDNLDTLNRQIFNIAVKGHTPNDLLDQRDKLLKEMSSITDFKTETDKYGRVEISVGETNVLTFEGEIDLAVDWGTEATKGAVKGYFDGKQVLESQLTEVKEFALTISEAFNSSHTKDSDDPVDIFEVGTDGRLRVNQILVDDNSRLMAGAFANSPVGDGTRAAAVAAIRNTALSFGTNGETTTLENKYNSMITKVGISKEHADNMVKNQNALVGQLMMRRESTSGVSIDEEVSNLVKYQKAFEANAKVMAVLTEMLDVLINRTGV